MSTFTLDDFRRILEPPLFVRFFLRVLFPFQRVLFLFGLAGPPDIDQELERDMRHCIGIIDSMTPQERTTPHIIDRERRQRIANGSGTTEDSVKSMLSTFSKMVQVMQEVKLRKSK